MIRIGLFQVGVTLAIIMLSQSVQAAAPSIDRVREDSTKVEDTLPVAPPDEFPVPFHEPGIAVLGLEQEPAKSTPGPVGDFSLNLGYSAPQGTFTRYAETGFHVLLRVNFRLRERFPLSFWTGLTFTHFSRRESIVQVEFPDLEEPYYDKAREVLEEDAYGLQVGLQLGNPTRRGFFRPRASIGVGLYVFSTTVKYFTLAWPDDEQIWGFTDQLLGRFGWRGIVGADLFFTPRWGASVDILYDHVLHLNLTDAANSRNITARFQGIAVGVVYALEFMD